MKLSKRLEPLYSLSKTMCNETSPGAPKFDSRVGIFARLRKLEAVSPV
jgi:hypothetical protein